MLKGLKIKNYRSFDPEGIYLQDLDKINIIIGENNTGKSNVLRFLDHLGHNLPIKTGNFKYNFKSPVDHYGLNPDNKIGFSFFFEPHEDFSQIDELREYTKAPYFLTYRSPNDSRIELVDSFLRATGEEGIRKYVLEKMGNTGGTFEERLADAMRRLKLEELFVFPTILFINEFRKIIENKEFREDVYNIIHYSYDHPELKTKSENIQKFVSEILGQPVEIRVPNLESEIELVFESEEKHLPLSSIGTGIHEIIILGLQLLTSDKAIVCLDEPELHLHPGTQRSFLKHIAEKTEHQYIISTHSSVFLDHEIQKSVYEARLVNGKTDINKCQQIEEVYQVLNDLGIRASEILQTNGIIWVEGPSDRIYINKWLELLGNKRKEGLEYTFQYYGGSLLKYYSVEDTTFKDFLNLLTINRNSYVVMDSDLGSSYNESKLTPSKQRLIEECRKLKIGFWVTDGREIENYLSNAVLSKYSGVSISRKKRSNIDTYCPKFEKKKKVKTAKEIVANMDHNEIKEAGFDLEEKITELSSSVDSWNK